MIKDIEKEIEITKELIKIAERNGNERYRKNMLEHLKELISNPK